jgi:DNA-directed RNA polymerase subunit F
MTTKPQIIEEKEISMVELADELSRIKKRDTELNFRGQKTEEYLGTFVTQKPKDVQEISQKIEKLNIPRLKQTQIIKMIDIMPKNLEDLKTIMQSYTLTVTDDNLKKINEILTEYTTKKK